MKPKVLLSQMMFQKKRKRNSRVMVDGKRFWKGFKGPKFKFPSSLTNQDQNTVAMIELRRLLELGNTFDFSFSFDLLCGFVNKHEFKVEKQLKTPEKKKSCASIFNKIKKVITCALMLQVYNHQKIFLHSMLLIVHGMSN